MSTNRRLVTLSRAVRPLLVLSTVLGAGVTILAVAQWVLAAWLINDIFLRGASLTLLRGLVLALAGVIIAKAALGGWREAVVGRAAVGIKNTLRESLHARFLALGPAFTAGERGADLATTAVDGVEKLEAYYARFLPQAALTAVAPLIVLGAAVLLDPLAALVLAVTGPIIPLFMWLVGTLAERHNRAQFQELRRLSSHFLDVLRGLPTLKLYGRGSMQADNLAAVGERYRLATMDVLRVAFLSGLVLELTATIATALVAVTVGLRLVDGFITFPRALAVLMLAPEFYQPFRQLGLDHHAGMEGAAAADRIFEVLDTPTPSAKPDSSLVTRGPGARHQAALRLEGVGFTYAGAKIAALSDVTLSLAAGERLAVAGATGSGKTTLLRLAARFLEPEVGRLQRDGLDAASVSPRVWRERLAFVTQTPHFFPGTVADNLRLARPGATLLELRTALKAVELADVVFSLPEGLDTNLGEDAGRLSGGERQRLAIARALLRDSPLVLLDEPTSALDPVSEAAVLKALYRLLEGRAALIVAHRRATLLSADRVVVLSQGRIVQLGRPRELAVRPGAFASLLGAPSERVTA